MRITPRDDQMHRHIFFELVYIAGGSEHTRLESSGLLVCLQADIEFEELFQYESSVPDIEIYDYVKAYEALRVSVDEHIIHNPTDIDVWFYQQGATHCVKAGETLQL